MKYARVLVAVGLLATPACVSYTGVSRAEGKLYISGDTSYFFYSAPFIKRCDEEGTALKCEELTELKQARGADTTTPATTTSATTAPSTPAAGSSSASPIK